MRRIFISDCEGPISKNDNAYELATNFVPEGNKLFANISKYDDVLADVLQKPGYSAGNTLKLVLPFFKAYYLTDKQMEDFSEKNIILIAGSKSTLNQIMGTAKSFIVSTSYEHYIRALCKALAFPYENTYCTKLRLNKYAISEPEKMRLRAIKQEISRMQIITIPPGAKAIEDFSRSDQKVIQRLNEIFWDEIPLMSSGKLFRDVVPVGGEEKAEAIRDAIKRSGVGLSDVMYVGDSITDVEAFKLVRANGGLTVSFNGNNYAVKNADVAILSENNLVIAVIADLFFKFGKEKMIRMIRFWSHQVLKKSGADEALLRQLSDLYPDALPKVQIVTVENMETLVQESSEFRKKVRGVAIGRLG